MACLANSGELAFTAESGVAVEAALGESATDISLSRILSVAARRPAQLWVKVISRALSYPLIKVSLLWLERASLECWA